MSARTTIVEVGSLAVRVAGDGAPVLLLHGIGGAATAFSAQQAGLADYRTIAWDAPGYGDSGDLDIPRNVPEPADAYADLAVDVLARLGNPKAHVVGVSWGGVIATRVALRRPDAVLSLTLADSTRGSGRTEAGRVGMLQRIEDLSTLGSRAFAEARGPNLLAPGPDPALLERVVDTMSRVRLAGYSAAARMMAATDHSARLDEITVPTLVLVGEHDRVTGVPESRHLAEGIPGSRFKIVPGGGHAVNQENPAAFNAFLREFLADVTASRPHWKVSR